MRPTCLRSVPELILLLILLSDMTERLSSQCLLVPFWHSFPFRDEVSARQVAHALSALSGLLILEVLCTVFIPTGTFPVGEHG